MCANCEYLTKDKLGCSNEKFVCWNGSEKLPAPATDYCCDLYEPNDKAMGKMRIG